MPQIEAMRIQYTGGSDVVFYQEEIESAIKTTLQDYLVQIHQEDEPAVMYKDEVYDALKVTFKLSQSDTESKIQTVIDAYKELSLYYAKRYETTSYLKCVPMPDGIETVEIFGQPAAMNTKTVTFLQTGVI